MSWSLEGEQGRAVAGGPAAEPREIVAEGRGLQPGRNPLGEREEASLLVRIDAGRADVVRCDEYGCVVFVSRGTHVRPEQ